MHPEVRAALEASIKHWEENVAAEMPEGVEIYASACALCRLFSERYEPDSEDENSSDTCYNYTFGKCPVWLRTGRDECGRSPWEEVRVPFAQWHDNTRNSEMRAAWRSAAQAELDFLKSLLSE